MKKEADPPVPPPHLVELALAVHQRLLAFYNRPKWHTTLSPLDELISTILSQNTNDQNRDAAFNNLKLQFPTWEAVRDAKKEQVIAAIQTAGLSNQKGPHIQAILRQITAERGLLDLGFLKELPPEKVHDWLLRFKGVGPKTAAIVMLFSLDMPAFPVDTHIMRVSGRVGLRPLGMNAEKTHIHLASLFPPEDYAAAHLNIIRLGREICSARNPHCTDCPLQDLCNYAKHLSEL